MHMLTLYVRTGCPFCIRVQSFMKEADIPYVEKNIADETVLKEILNKGGVQQVPFLMDDERDVLLYESIDIIEYLNQYYMEETNNINGGDKEEDTEDYSINDDTRPDEIFQCWRDPDNQ